MKINVNDSTIYNLNLQLTRDELDNLAAFLRKGIEEEIVLWGHDFEPLVDELERLLLS